MRLIDADALCEGLVSNHPVAIAAKCAPTIEANPVVHAKWEKVNEWMPIYRCSECKERNLFRDGDNVLTNFCPHCNAKMDA